MPLVDDDGPQQDPSQSINAALIGGVVAGGIALIIIIIIIIIIVAVIKVMRRAPLPTLNKDKDDQVPPTLVSNVNILSKHS